MIVVIPVCAKDEELVLKNLDWVANMDRTIAGDCIISCPEGFDSRSVYDKADEIFDGKLAVVSYPEWGGDPKWPHPQNWAWQCTARSMTKPWLWWEADSTPIRKGWIESIQKEYEAGGKPFMGYVTEDNGSDSHMAGVGVYPANVAQYSTSAMLCRATAFDIVLSRDTLHLTHRANHLIQHYRREDGDSTHFHDHASVEAVVRPGVVLFHRCKDGSLIDRLRNPRSVSKALKSFFVKPKTPERKWPSILKQTKWEAGFFDLPSHGRECHFNCAIVEAQKTLWLVSRRWRRNAPAPWTSDLVRHRLEGMKIVESRPIIVPKQLGPMEQHEDPRIICRGDGFLLSYCSWLLGGKYQAHQAVAQLDSGWNCLSTFHLVYGKNGRSSGEGTGHEKNWTWFYHDRKLHLDYQFSPHIVLSVDSETGYVEHKTETPMASLWKCGQIRGGSPPVRVGDEYVAFFHSSMPWRARQNRYFMGAYAFESKPPFVITRMTTEPLLVGSEEDIHTLGGPLVVFPCGATIDTIYRIPHRDSRSFLVTLGVNDQACAWIEIPKDELFSRMC